MSKRSFRPTPAPEPTYPKTEAGDRRWFLARLGAVAATGLLGALGAGCRGADAATPMGKKKPKPKPKPNDGGPKKPRPPVPGGPMHPRAELDKVQR